VLLVLKDVGRGGGGGTAPRAVAIDEAAKCGLLWRCIALLLESTNTLWPKAPPIPLLLMLSLPPPPP